MKYDDKTIKKFEEHLAKKENIHPRCKVFGRKWAKKDQDCKNCEIDSAKYFELCRQFTKGIGRGFLKGYSPKDKRIERVFKEGSRKGDIYDYLKKNESATLNSIMKYFRETYSEKITRNNVRTHMVYMRKDLKVIGHEELKNYKGHYFIKKTRSGMLYDTKRKKKECSD